jgi:hypothetical protein
MVKPEELLPLPQDVYTKKATAPKSTKEQYERFLERSARAKAGGTRTVAELKNTNG